jgi:ribosomal protein S4
MDKVLSLAKLASSASEAARKLREGAVSVDGVKRTDPVYYVNAGESVEILIKLGRHFKRVRIDP